MVVIVIVCVLCIEIPNPISLHLAVRTFLITEMCGISFASSSQPTIPHPHTTHVCMCGAEGLVGASKIVATHGTMPSPIYIYAISNFSRSVSLYRCACDIINLDFRFLHYDSIDSKMNSGMCASGPYAYFICAHTIATARFI